MSLHPRRHVPVLISLVGALAVPQAGAAPQVDAPTYRAFPYLVPAGDLDGDGLDDTLSYERVPDTEIPEVGVVRFTPRLSARRGSDGAVLWERSDRASAVLPAPLGPGPAPGALVVDGFFWYTVGSGFCTCGNAHGDHLEARELTLRALDGRGVVLWDRIFEAGLFAEAAFVDEHDGRRQAGAAERFPAFGGVVQATPSPARDVLVSVLTRREVLDQVQTTLQVVIVDGASGATATSFDVAGSSRSSINAAGDLDGDGLDDVLVLRSPTAGGLTAFRSSGGPALWSTSEDVVPYSASVNDLGDVTGDGIDDLAVRGSGDVFEDVPPRVTVVDGSDGSVLFSTSAAAVGVAGDLDEQGTVGILTQRVIQEPERAVEYRLFTSAGEPVAERLVPVPQVEGESTYVQLVPSAGDLDGDGVADPGHQRSRYTGDGGTTYEGTVLSGRTLSTILAGSAGVPLRASLDGSGDDLVRVRRTSATAFAVEAQDGASGDALWSSTLAADGQYPRSGRVAALHADVDGDDIPEVILTLESSRWVTQPNGGARTESIVRSWVLRGSDGAVLWAA